MAIHDCLVQSFVDLYWTIINTLFSLQTILSYTAGNSLVVLEDQLNAQILSQEIHLTLLVQAVPQVDQGVGAIFEIATSTVQCETDGSMPAFYQRD